MEKRRRRGGYFLDFTISKMLPLKFICEITRKIFIFDVLFVNKILFSKTGRIYILTNLVNIIHERC